VGHLAYGALPAAVRQYARRHLLDTVGVMIAGAGGEVATRAEAVLVAMRPAGRVPVPGRARRADLLDAAFLGGTAAHGIELDDGYRQGSVHPGCTVVPAALAVAYERSVNGKALIEAIVPGYETVIAFGRAGKARAITLPPQAPFGITDCYIKPYACCRRIQPAVEALIGLLNDEDIAPAEIERVEAETYRIAAEHAHTGWDDFASAQLSFPFLMAPALNYRRINV